MLDRRIATAKGHIRSKIEQGGLDPGAAARVVADELSAFGIADVENVVSAALKEYRDEQHRIEYLQVATIPRRRRKDWYGGPTEEGIWHGLQRYLLHVKKWDADTTVRSIDETSSKIVSLLDNPGSSRFSTRSLVVGYVQSGKTANMTAVAAKSVDANYKFVVILAGMTDALRSQTQTRIETDLIDQDPDRWYRWTTVDMDFSDAPDAGFPAPHPASRHIAVVKKNKWVLLRFLNKLRNTPSQVLRNIPFLIIDDECDQASVNGARYRDEMTAINEHIRRILQAIPRCAYIGYTATPFANVLIDPAVSIDKDCPDDLYPVDFIVALPKPQQYFGAESLFGRGLLDADQGEPDSEGLDMIRIVEDEETESLQPKSSKDREKFSLDITSSLEAAIRYYLLATAARCARGQIDQHSSMLIHTTVYTAPHFDAKLKIAGYLKDIFQRIKSRNLQVMTELRDQWDSEKDRVDPALFGNDTVQFDELAKYLAEAAESVDVVVENGVSDERLDYSGDQPRRYIVVGGSVLARGLTIEGLVVSLFLRTSSQYDSIMQMGRWFGYRSGYEDLPRVWMTREMRDAFKELATVEAEIRAEIDTYRDRDITPLDFAVRIRQIPGMSITARNKMLAAQTCDISYSSEHIQTTRFKHKDEQWLNSNWQAGVRLVNDAAGQCGDAKSLPRGRLFRGVSVGAIARFLHGYQTHHSHRNFQAGELLEYIESQNERADGCLATWNVGVIEPSRGSKQSSHELGELGHVKTVVRALLWDTKDGDADIKALMSRSDILIDCPNVGAVEKDTWQALKSIREAETNAAPLIILYAIEAASKPRSGSGTGKDGNPNRAPLNAEMDVLGVGIVFPVSPIATADRYVRVTLPDQEFEEAELFEIANDEIA